METVSFIIMDNLFNEYAYTEEYKNIIVEPLNADEMLNANKRYCHTQHAYFITDNAINHINKVILIKDRIKYLCFLYTDFGEKEWDNKYWFFVGKLNNGIYFMYETICCGTGFGLGAESKLYLSKKPEYLIKYSFTNKHRDLIKNNIHRRFICSKV
jgi:hypothetical protein